MKSYKGFQNSDSIRGGGSFVKEMGYGHEMFNFLPFDGYCYGFVETKQREGIRNTIHIDRLGASKTDDYIEGVLVIWVAKDPEDGTKIIGWYNNAIVYKKEQESKDSRRQHNNERFGFFVKAKAEDCRLLSLDERIFDIPRKQKGGFGQSNLWYADQSESEQLVQKVMDYIYYNKIESPKQVPNAIQRQLDPFRRSKVEIAAITLIKEYYEKLGYLVGSVERDNVGWDLEAIREDKILRLEVKGLSQESIMVEITPNEYEKMSQNKNIYRICIVTNALSDHPKRAIFSFSFEKDCWEDDNGRKLEIEEIHKVSARGYV